MHRPALCTSCVCDWQYFLSHPRSYRSEGQDRIMCGTTPQIKLSRTELPTSCVRPSGRQYFQESANWKDKITQVYTNKTEQRLKPNSHKHKLSLSPVVLFKILPARGTGRRRLNGSLNSEIDRNKKLSSRKDIIYIKTPGPISQRRLQFFMAYKFKLCFTNYAGEGKRHLLKLQFTALLST